uniref:Calponin-homology (CH) domain-containing protein n=1 Tax=Panagrellus redivivus TaxID=6233 RepID=A0A7E4V6S8_PANRE
MPLRKEALRKHWRGQNVALKAMKKAIAHWSPRFSRKCHGSTEPGPSISPLTGVDNNVKLYTTWANRYLAKAKLEPINELTTELSDHKRLIRLLNAITSDCPGAVPDQLLCALNATSPVEALDKCLTYLAQLGANVSGIQSRELLNGELVPILTLLYSLSHFKQQQKLLQFSRPSSVATTTVSSFRPSSTTATAPTTSQQSNCGGNNMAPNLSSSRLAAPTTRTITLPPSKPPATVSQASGLSKGSSVQGLKSGISGSGIKGPSVRPPSTGLPKSTSKLKPPGSTPIASGRTSRIQSPARATSSASLISSTSTTTTSTYATIPTPKVLKTPSSSKIASPKIVKTPTTPSPAPGHKTGISTPTGSKMLKLFGSNRDKKPTPKAVATPAPTSLATSPSTSTSATNSRSPSVSKVIPPTIKPAKTGLKPPTNVKVSVTTPTTPSKLPATSLSTVARPSGLKKPTIGAAPTSKVDKTRLSTTSTTAGKSHTSGGSSPVSPPPASTSVTNSSPHVPPMTTTPSTSTHSSRSDFDDSGIHSDTTSASIPAISPGMEIKPVLAVKGISAPIKKQVANTNTANASDSQMAQTSISLATPGTTVGVVSPMRLDPKSPTESVASSSALKPEKDVDNGGNDEVMPMEPLKLTEMAIRHSKVLSHHPQVLETIPGGASDGSLESISTAIHCSPTRRYTAGFSEGEALAAVFPDTPVKGVPASTSQGSSAMPPASGNRRRVAPPKSGKGGRGSGRNEYSTVYNGRLGPERQHKHHGYDFDSFEDSSSISSGISENFDDISTDDLTGSSLNEFPMTAATASVSNGNKLGADLHPMAFRSGPGKSNGLRHVGNGNSNGVQQSASSNRLYHTLVPKLALSEDGETLSISRHAQGRSSLRCPPTINKTGVYGQYQPPHQQPYHQQQSPAAPVVQSTGSARNSPYHSQSLDRRGHLKAVFGPESGTAPNSPYRLSVASGYANGNGTAVLSPRNSAGGMSSEGYASGRQSAAGSFSSRSEANDVYANYPALHFNKMSSPAIRPSPLSAKLPSSRPVISQGGSELSLASSSAADDRYEAEIRKLHVELDGYRERIHSLHEKNDSYNQIIQLFDSRLQQMFKYCNKLNRRSQLKEDEVEKLKSQIEYLRSLSSCATPMASAGVAHTNNKSPEGAGELLRQYPSMESVASHKSSVSAVSSKAGSFGGKNGKKSWIRSSFSRAFTKKKSTKTNGASSDAETASPMHRPADVQSITSDESRPGVPDIATLKQELQVKEAALTDIRLDALDKAREVDILRETVARLANENKLLKRNCTMLARRTDSRTSSRQSLSTCQDDDPTYDALPPSSATPINCGSSERSYSSTTSSSKRSSGSLVTRVAISLEPSGSLEFNSHQHELTIGSLMPPSAAASWSDVDAQLVAMLKDYLHRIESESTMGIDPEKAIVGYKIGSDFIRDKNCPDLLTPSASPAEIIAPTKTIRLRLRGVNQDSVDGLIVESLFPKATLDQLIRLLEQSRRLVIHGARGIGKSNLAKTLAKYFSLKLSTSGKAESIVEVRYPDDEKDKKFAQTQANLQALLKSSTASIILIDNVHRKIIPHLQKAFKCAEGTSIDGELPFVICTVNGALQAQVEEMQRLHAFRVFHLTNHMDAVRGFMGRYLRRRIAEAELTGQCRCGPALEGIIDFLGKALVAINTFIDRANAQDEIIGPRTFVQCPLSIEASRDWFIRLWNENLVPYILRAARSTKAIGYRSPLTDPTTFILEQWPWPNPNGSASALLQRVVLDSASQTPEKDFDPMLALERIEENRKLQDRLH